MALPPSGSGVTAPPEEDHQALALSLIRLRGYVEPDPDLLDEIVRDARAAAAANEARSGAPAGTAMLDHLDRLVRAAAAAGRLQSV